MATPVAYRKYRIGFSLFLTVLLSGFFIGILVYNGPFNILTDPFSWLGASETEDGYDNRASMVVFAVDMVISAIIFGALAVVFVRDKNVPLRGIRVLFSILAAFGACIATFPNNYFLVQHQVGAGFLVGSIWLHAIFFIVDASRVSSKGYSAFLHVLLQSTVLTYAFTFFVDAPNRDVFQKFAIAGLALSIELSLGVLCKDSTPVTEANGVEELEETEAGH
jgi:hypothetical protein